MIETVKNSFLKLNIISALIVLALVSIPIHASAQVEIVDEEEFIEDMNNISYENELRKAEKEYAKVYGFRMKEPKVAENVAYRLNKIPVRITGALMELIRDNKSAQLFITKPAEKDVLVSQVDEKEYKRVLEIEMSFHLGATAAEDLYFSAPVKITLPVPIGMKPEKVVMLYGDEENVDSFIPRNNLDGTISFYVHEFAKYYAFAECKEDFDEVLQIMNEAADAVQGARPVYRLVNRDTTEGIYLADIEEARDFYLNGWGFEGVAWYAPEKGIPVYRLRNNDTGYHRYTTSISDIYELTDAGWDIELDGKPAFYSGGSQDVFGLGFSNDMHHYTLDINQNNALAKAGWTEEITFKSVVAGALCETEYYH